MIFDQGKGMVGLLLTDRDAHLVKKSMECLNCALESVQDYAVDLVVSLRECDQIAETCVKMSVPARIQKFEFLYCDYDAKWTEECAYHTDEILDAICMQRNALKDYARVNVYDFIVFLDSDIYLKKDTIRLLIDYSNAQSPVLAVPYQPRWSKHVVIGVFQHGGYDQRETQLQFLLNPQLLDFEISSVGIIGFGCAIIRKYAFHVNFKIAETTGGIRGEDMGFCEDLRAFGIQPKCILGYFVEHESAGQSFAIFIPYVDSSRSYVSHVRIEQLALLEQAKMLNWRLCSEDQSILDISFNDVLLSEFLGTGKPSKG
jgi:hypothetical protein